MMEPIVENENPLGLMTTQEAAEYLRVSTKTIEALRAKNHLPAVRIGRRVFFKRNTLDEYVNEQIPHNLED